MAIVIVRGTRSALASSLSLVGLDARALCYGGGGTLLAKVRVGLNERWVVSVPMKTSLQLERYLAGLVVTQGEGIGQPLRVLPWQRRFLRGFDAPGDLGLSIGRGNGKTALVAGIAAAAIDPDGPLSQRRGEVVIVASSFGQARIDYEHCLAFLQPRIDADPRAWRILDTNQTASIEHRETGARVRCIGSDPRRAHGLAPVLVLADEPAQWEHTKADAMVAALRTAMGKMPGARFVALGTRPAEAAALVQCVPRRMRARVRGAGRRATVHAREHPEGEPVRRAYADAARGDPAWTRCGPGSTPRRSRATRRSG